MNKANFSDDSKRDAMLQITERGYPVAEVPQRFGVGAHSLYAWKERFSHALRVVVSGRGHQFFSRRAVCWSM